MQKIKKSNCKKKINAGVSLKQPVAAALVVLFCFHAKAQNVFSRYEKEVALTKNTLDLIYNFEFEEASENIGELEAKMGNHPGVSLLKALAVYWRHSPLDPGSDARKDYERHLSAAAEQADAILQEDKNNVEGVFFTLASYGYLTGLYADDGNVLKALGHARKAYSALKAGFDLKDEYAEFYFSTGLYNYYREKYPENNPAYRAVSWLFQSGDKELGVEQLKVAAEQALFTKMEAQYYLYHIYLRYEVRPQSALEYARSLAAAYPDNLVFQAYLAEALIAAGSETEAQAVVDRLLGAEREYYRMPGYLFSGGILEKQSPDEAKRRYQQVLDMADGAAFETEHYESMAWAGLARIASLSGNEKAARENYERALKVAKYDIVIDEAEAYLD